MVFLFVVAVVTTVFFVTAWLLERAGWMDDECSCEACVSARRRDVFHAWR